MSKDQVIEVKINKKAENLYRLNLIQAFNNKRRKFKIAM